MNIHDIVQEYLEKNGYDGLYHPDECACKKDDLFPCDCLSSNCEPGYLKKCDCEEGWHISPIKEGRDEQNDEVPHIRR